MSLASIFAVAKADLQEGLAILSKLAGYAPEAADAAEVAATLTGNAELDPIIAAAASGVVALNDASHSANVQAAVTNLAAAASAFKTVAQGAAASAAPADAGGPGPGSPGGPHTN